MSLEDCSAGTRSTEGSLQGGSHHDHFAIRSVGIAQASSAEMRQTDAAKPPESYRPAQLDSDQSDKDMAIWCERTACVMANECTWELCIELLLLPRRVSLISPHALLRILDTNVAASGSLHVFSRRVVTQPSSRGSLPNKDMPDSSLTATPATEHVPRQPRPTANRV